MSDKFALITGGAKRIGANLARFFHSSGYNIILHYHNSAYEAEKISKSLNKLRKESCFLMQCDFNEINSIESIKNNVSLITKKLDVLINNASSFYETPIEDASTDQWKDLLDTNITTPLFLTQALVQHLKVTDGSVINISDSLVSSGIARYSLYSSAKSALENLTKSLAKELAPEIRVNCIAPGAILWPEDKELSEKEKAEILKNVSLRSIGKPEDISSTALFLVQSSYITGQIIKVDGGRFEL